MKLDILAIGAHPDDVELGCGATIAKEVAAGKKVGILDLTRGELGTRGTAEIRDKEAANAAASQLEIIKIIRKYKPEVILCNAIEDRHIDHAKGSRLVSDACFLSGLRKIETIYEGNKQEAWRPAYVYHYIQWKNLTPDFVVDVTGFMDTKMDAVMAYKSQFFDPDIKEPDTPISSPNFKDSIVYRARDLGRLSGIEFAEGFTVERCVTVNSVFDLK